jgi:hypothetical protein
VCPIQHHIVAGAVQRRQSVFGELGEVKGPQGEVLEARLKLCFDVISGWMVVRVSEDLDIRVQSLQCMFGML